MYKGDTGSHLGWHRERKEEREKRRGRGDCNSCNNERVVIISKSLPKRFSKDFHYKPPSSNSPSKLSTSISPFPFSSFSLSLQNNCHDIINSRTTFSHTRITLLVSHIYSDGMDLSWGKYCMFNGSNDQRGVSLDILISNLLCTFVNLPILVILRFSSLPPLVSMYIFSISTLKYPIAPQIKWDI
jgi:hypothetical protein